MLSSHKKNVLEEQAFPERYRIIESNCQLYVTEKYERSLKKNNIINKSVYKGKY